MNLTGSPCWTWTEEDLQIDWRVGADWFEVRIAVGPYEMAKDGKGLECHVKEVLKTLKTLQLHTISVIIVYHLFVFRFLS